MWRGATPASAGVINEPWGESEPGHGAWEGPGEGQHCQMCQSPQGTHTSPVGGKEQGWVPVGLSSLCPPCEGQGAPSHSGIPATTFPLLSAPRVPLAVPCTQ